jgi:hypothetical protein
MEGKEVTTMETTFKVTRTGLYVDVWVTRNGRTQVYTSIARDEAEAEALMENWRRGNPEAVEA